MSINAAERLLNLEQSGVKINYSVDASVIHTYLNIPINVFINANKSMHDIVFFDYSSVALVLEHFSSVIKKKITLMPFYEVELEDNINYQKTIIRKKLNNLNTANMFSNNVRSLLRNEVIKTIVGKHKKTNYKKLSVEEEQAILDVIYKNFSEIYFFLIFNSEAVNEQYKHLEENLTEIPDNSIDLDADSLNQDTDIIFDRFNKLKDDPEYRFANYVDASCLSLTLNINKQKFLNNKEFLVLISDAPSLLSVAKDYDNLFKFISASETMSTSFAPLAIHPYSILLYLFASSNNHGIPGFSLLEIGDRLDKFSTKIRAGASANMDTFFDYVLFDYSNRRTASSLKFEEMQYMLKNSILQKNKIFKNNISDEIQKMLNVITSQQSVWDTYRTSMINTFSKRDKYIVSTLHTHRKDVKSASYLIYGIYLFDYDNEDVNRIIEDVTLDDNIEKVLSELKDLKDKDIAEAYHLSAYVHGKIEMFEEALEDIKIGISLCTSDEEMRKFQYLENINLANRGLLNKALLESKSLADKYGNVFPRFWLHLGFLFWQRAHTSNLQSTDISNAIKFTNLAIDIAMSNEDKYYKCILLGLSNLVRYTIENNDINTAGERLKYLKNRFTFYHKTKPPTEKLPLFDYVSALYNIEILKSDNKLSKKEKTKLCLEVREYTNSCKMNLLVINKNARDDYMHLIEAYKSICNE